MSSVHLCLFFHYMKAFLFLFFNNVELILLNILSIQYDSFVFVSENILNYVLEIQSF